MSQAQVEIKNLNNEQIMQAKQQLESRLQTLQETENNLKAIGQKTENEKKIIESLTNFETPHPYMIVSLTDNLYLRARIKNKDEFVYDLGTGYLAKIDSKSVQNQMDFTSQFCKQNIQSIQEEFQQKKESHTKIIQEILI